MSNTPKVADDVQKLLDNGHTVVLRMCGLGSYMALSVKDDTEAGETLNDAIDTCLGWDGEEAVDSDQGREFDDNMPGVIETDDFTPSQALYRLTEKVTTGRIVGCDEPVAPE